MQDFIVLGIIPGTNIQINFMVWMVLFVLALGGSYLAWRERTKHTLLLLLIWASLARDLRRRQRA